MKKKIIFLFLTCAVLVTGCDELFGVIRKPVTARDISIDPEQTYQTMNGFAASDAWCGNIVGQFWDEAQKEQIARWLFSQEMGEDGSPEGIGLSMWRVNLGGGSWEQGNSSGIGGTNMATSYGEWMRRAESFLADVNAPGAGYDWSKQAGQQYFFKKAKEYGCEYLVAFSNSPPIPWTKNGKATNTGNSGVNLREDSYDDFAAYLADIAAYFQEQEHITFDFISPVNEPQYQWNGSGQEGSSWTNANIKMLVRELDQAIQARASIKDSTKILVTEAASWKYLFNPEGSAGDQIRDFFVAGNQNYIGNLPSVPNIIGGHSYYSHDTDALLRENRTQVRQRAEEYGVEVYQTEWSMLSGGQGIPSPENASYMDIALYLAKLIHCDITIAGVSSWAYWTAMDMERWGHKDRFALVGLAPGVRDFDNVSYLNYPVTQTGAIKDFPTLWALGNFSLFVRPGFTRIYLEGADDLMGLMGTAYLAPAGDRIVAVYVNMGTEPVELRAVFADGRQPGTISCYLTDETRAMSLTAASGASFTIPPRSVFTVVYDF